MSVTGTDVVIEEPSSLKKRKRETNEEDIEIDINAPEPPSKKALRKAKKSKPEKSNEASSNIKFQKDGAAEDVIPNQGKRSEYGIWIGNLSFTTTKQDLLDFMISDVDHVIPQEAITRIHLPAGPSKHGKFQNKGFAYIDLKDDTSLRSALELSEKLLAGRRVLIKNATSFEGRPERNSKDTSAHPPSKRIFVGNLDYDTTVEELEQHFGICGPIQHTQVATFEDSGKCKGYAWVDFEQLSSGQAAMRGWVEGGLESDLENGKRSKRRTWLNKLKGRKLRMEFAEDKTVRYNKRFGKKATDERLGDDAPAIEEVTGEGDAKVVEPAIPQASGGRSDQHARQSRTHDKRKKTQGYTRETVQRLRGAITEGQGQKVTFD